MAFIKQTKQVASVTIRESGRALALSARVISEAAFTCLTGVIALNSAITKELSEENKARLQTILSEIDSGLKTEDDSKKES